MAVQKRPTSGPIHTTSGSGFPVLDASPNAILGADARGHIVYANARVERTFGWPPAELLGSTVERLIPSHLAKRHAAHRAAFAANPTARPMGIGLDLAGRRRDGSEFPVEISLAPVDTPAGPLVFATIVDITSRKTLEGQLLQAQKMESVGRLAGGIAHDFNNMLFAIRGYADLLLEDLDAADGHPIDRRELRRSVEGIGAAADRATALTAQLLAFSRQQVVHPVVIDPREAVVALEPMLRRLIGEPIRLVLSLTPDTGAIRTDPGQLDQILVNLVVNARDAMPGGGAVTIETANVDFDEAYAVEHFEVAPGRYVMLAVTDTGHGMDRETRRHIFEPFFTTKEPGKGTGLGLATIYGIVRQGGGHIWLYSEPGRGTTFKCYFPRVEAVPADAPQSPIDEPRHASRTILLVEDEPTVRELSRRVLERAGYAVIAPSDPREALLLAESRVTAIDALVTDVVMPDVSGPDLARRMLAVHPGTPVVLLSGYSQGTAHVDDLVQQGAVFASKPLGTRDLLTLLDRALRGRTLNPSGGA